MYINRLIQFGTSTRSVFDIDPQNFNKINDHTNLIDSIQIQYKQRFGSWWTFFDMRLQNNVHLLHHFLTIHPCCLIIWWECMFCNSTIGFACDKNGTKLFDKKLFIANNTKTVNLTFKNQHWSLFCAISDDCACHGCTFYFICTHSHDDRASTFILRSFSCDK